MRQRRLKGHLFSWLVWGLLALAGGALYGGVSIIAQTGQQNTLPTQRLPAGTLPTQPIRSPATTAQLSLQIRSFDIKPSAIQADVEQTVSISATISRVGLPAGTSISVLLYRLDGAKPVTIAKLNDAGVDGDTVRGDGVYSTQVKLKEKAGIVPLRVEVEPSGARTTSARIVSQTQNLQVRAVAQRLPTVEIVQLSPSRVTAGSPTGMRVRVRVTLSGFRVERADVLREKTRLGTLKSIGKDATFETFEATVQLPSLNPGNVSITAVAYVVPAASEFATAQPITSKAQVLQVEAVRPPALSVAITDVRPRQVRQNVRTEVVVTAALSSGWSLQSGQLLERGVTQPLAAFRSSGTPATLTARFVVQRSALGRIQLVASVDARPAAGLAGQVLRAVSSAAVLQVVPGAVSQVQDKGLVLTVPEGFSRVDTKGANIFLTNGPIDRGGFPSRGVCFIEATRTPRSGATRDLMASETEVRAPQIATLSVAGRPAFRADYREEAGLGRSLDYVAVYVESPNAVHKFFLSFLTGDGAANRCRGSLDSVLGSARITE